MVPANPIFKMFGRSPIRPLQQHMAKAHESAHALTAFFAAVIEGDWHKAAQQQACIVELEHAADAIKLDIRSHLPKNLFLPVPRGDVLQILTTQDKIPNKSRDIAGLVLGRKMQLPASIAPAFLELVRLSIDCTEQCLQAINELDELLESGFSGNEIHCIQDIITKLSETEHQSDEQQILVRRELFDIEKDLAPIDVMFLYKLLDWTGEIADRAEQVGEYLQLILAR